MYEIECWLTTQLLNTKPPSASDVDMLNDLVTDSSILRQQWPLAPCCSFTRVVLYHTYKATSRPQQNVMQLVLYNLDYTFTQDKESYPWSLYEFAIGLTWCKLAELVLSVLVLDGSSLIDQVSKRIFHQSGLLGYKMIDIPTDDYDKRVLLQHVVNSKSKLSFALAKALVAKVRESTVYPCSCIDHKITNKTQETFPKITSQTHITEIKKYALRLGAYSAAIEKSSGETQSRSTCIR